MGNTCGAQDCVALKSQESDSAFDVDGEYDSVPAYAAQDLPRIGLGPPLPSPKATPVFGGRSSEEVVGAVDDRDVFQDRGLLGKKGMVEAIEQMQTASEPMRDPALETVIVSSTPPSGSAPSLEMVFDVDGSRRCVQLLRRPLGAEFSKHDSGIKIERIRPQSHAAELGIEVGWSVIAVGGEDMTRRTLEEMQGVLKHGMMVLPMSSPTSNAGLELIFDVGGSEKRIQLNRRPLGAEFGKRTKDPTRIENVRPQSYAAELGLQKGWIIKSIGGEDVTTKSFAQTQATLQKAMSVLPTA